MSKNNFILYFIKIKNDTQKKERNCKSLNLFSMDQLILTINEHLIFNFEI